MDKYKSERRRYTRVYFSNHDYVTAIIKLSDNHEKFLTAIVKDLSEGGIGFAVKKDQKNKIITGRPLIIKKIQGSQPLGFITALKLKVIWVLDCDGFEHVGFGCRFLDIPQAIRQKIRNYVQAWTDGAFN